MNKENPSMKKMLLILFLILPVVLLVWADAGAQPSVFADCGRRVDSLVAKDVHPSTPGGVVGVIQGGRVVFKKAYGLANMDYRIPNGFDTRFNLASVSKQFTAYGCLLLAGEGRLDLDADIHQYLPELPDYGVKITTRQLLHHTSGMTNTEILQLFAGTLFEKDWGMEEEFDLLKRYKKMNFKPNDEHVYCNTGYAAAARIIEKISGQSLNGFLIQKVFKPLGMHHSEIFDRKGKIMADRAAGYSKKDSVFVIQNTLSSSLVGSTNLYTSLDDMLLWDRHLLNPPPEDRDAVDRMMNPSDTFNNGDTIKYTYGFNVWNYKGRKIAEHSGYTPGFVTRNILFPELDFAVVAMFNTDKADIWNLTMQTADSLLKDKLKFEPKKERSEAKIKPGSAARYAGVYALPDGMRLPFEAGNDTLWLVIPGAPKFRMVPENETEFFIREFDAQCTYVKDDAGNVDRIVWHQNGQNPDGFRVRNQKALSVKELTRYAGNYIQPVLEVVYPVRVENQQLIVRVPSVIKDVVGVDRDVKLFHQGGDSFFTEKLGIVEFTRGPKKKITGLTFKDVGRERNIEFRKL
jgi:CubicO group peptidase (beta-lactamase class C family)